MRDVSTQLVGLLILIIPLLAIQWNFAGGSKRDSALLAPDRSDSRWRLEIYSVEAGAAQALADPADVPFPVKRVRSAKSAQAVFSPDDAWTLPRVELDVDVQDPFADDCLNGLLGSEHDVLFVSGNEAVVDTEASRIRIRAIRYG